MFAELARKFQGTSWMEVGPAERDEVVSHVLRSAGLDHHHLEVRQLRDHYRDQDGSSTGETYLVNTCCPLTVVGVEQVSLDRQVVADDYRATLWLSNTVSEVASERDAGQAIAKLARIIVDSKPLTPIRLTRFGDDLVEARSLDDHARDGDVIWKKTVVHNRCRGILELHPCSDEWRALTCRRCHLRVRVPVGVTTFGQLREYALSTVDSGFVENSDKGAGGVGRVIRLGLLRVGGDLLGLVREEGS
jgi:hypothetical protein